MKNLKQLFEAQWATETEKRWVQWNHENRKQNDKLNKKILIKIIRKEKILELNNAGNEVKKCVIRAAVDQARMSLWGKKIRHLSIQQVESKEKMKSENLCETWDAIKKESIEY